MTPGDCEEEPGEEEGTDDAPDWASRRWYRSRVGVGVVAFDVALTLALVVATTELFRGDPVVVSVQASVVPWYVYAFGALGALGYVFTALIDDVSCDTAKLLQWNLRVPAALPLGAGVFLLSDVVLGRAVAVGPVVTGLVFLAGLYVNLAYERLGALAERLLPAGGDAPEPRAAAGGRETTTGGDRDVVVNPTDGEPPGEDGESTPA